MAEWFKAAVLKTANPQGFVGSNPTPSDPDIRGCPQEGGAWGRTGAQAWVDRGAGFRAMEAMAKPRSHRVAFKRQVARECRAARPYTA